MFLPMKKYELRSRYKNDVNQDSQGPSNTANRRGTYLTIINCFIDIIEEYIVIIHMREFYREVGCR